MDQSLPEAVKAAALRPEVREAVARVYADLQAEIDARRPLCVISGRCCRFEEFGHRLYVTTLELATFCADLPVFRPGGVAESAWDGTGCPFQVGKLCGVHRLRPFGCRIFFCDTTSTVWQHDAYERLHAVLRRRHDELEVPYFYVEWRRALEMLGLAQREVSVEPDSL